MALGRSSLLKYRILRTHKFIGTSIGRNAQMASIATFKVPKVENESNVGGNCLASGLLTALFIKCTTQRSDL